METYMLVGFINMFEIIPAFIFPIYMLKSELYIQEGEQNKISDIVPLKKELYSKVIPLHEIRDFKYLEKQTRITVESLPKYAFQATEDKIIYGEFDILLKYFEGYKANDEILEEQISDFKSEVGYKQRKRVNSEIDSFAKIGSVNKAIAQVLLAHGTGKIIINNKNVEEYFRNERLIRTVRKPIITTEIDDKIDVFVKVRGGAEREQAFVISKEIQRALRYVDMNSILKRRIPLYESEKLPKRPKPALKGEKKSALVRKR